MSKYREHKKGSLTVEAALVLPVFLYTIIIFLYFIQFFTTYETIQEGITEVAKYSAKYAYLYENIGSDKEEDNSQEEKESSLETSNKNGNTIPSTEDSEAGHAQESDNNKSSSKLTIIDKLFYWQKLKAFLGNDSINLSNIENGFNGLSFYYSSFMADQGMVDVVVKYKFKFPNVIFRIKSFQVVQRVRMHGWVGYQRENTKSDNNESNKEEDIVYVTETGTVYHSTKECSHLKLSIQNVTYGSIKDLRNNNGGKYKECEICHGFSELSFNSIIYITDTGDRYHTNAACSGLKRTILEIPLSQVGARTPCKRCYGN